MGFELLNRGPVYVVVFVLFMMLVVIQFSFSSSVVSPKLLVRTQRQLEPSDLLRHTRRAQASLGVTMVH